MVVKLTSNFLEAPVARAIPGAFYDTQEKAWLLVDPTPRSAAVALRMFPTLAITYPELAEMRDSLAREMRPFANSEKLRIPVEAPLVHDQLAARGSDFYAFQNFDLGYCTQVLMEHHSVYVGWERGLGKTLGACALIEATGSQYALVVCPNTAKASVWGPELATWLPGHEVVVLRNSRVKREQDLGYVQQLREAGVPHVLVVHYEALAIIAGDLGKGWLKYGKWDMIVADEAHRIANPKAKMTKALKKIPTLYKVALSGSIIMNNLEELFSPLQWLYPQTYRSKWRDWNDRFIDFADGAWGRKICVGVKPDQLDALRNELGVFFVYRRKSDELDLPARTEQTLYVDMGPAQTKVYNDLINDSMAELPDGTFLKAEEGLVLLGRLRQVATGLSLVSAEYNPTTAKTKPPLVFADSSKLDLAIDLIRDSGEPTVVFAWYKASAYELSHRLSSLGIDHYAVTGDTRHEDRAKYIAEFQSGLGQVFIGTLSTLGESVTLHRASSAIFLDRAWNPSVNLQAADRIYRIGQQNPVTITHIIARGTVDELRVQPVLDDKEALRALVLGT